MIWVREEQAIWQIVNARGPLTAQAIAQSCESRKFKRFTWAALSHISWHDGAVNFLSLPLPPLALILFRNYELIKREREPAKRLRVVNSLSCATTFKNWNNLKANLKASDGSSWQRWALKMRTWDSAWRWNAVWEWDGLFFIPPPTRSSKNNCTFDGVEQN